MAGSVYPYQLKNGARRWGFAIDLGMKWDERKQRSVRQQLRREGFKRRLDAENALLEEQHGVKVGTAPSLQDRRLTVAQWADRWLAGRVSIRPTTRYAYAHVLGQYVKPALGRQLLAEVRADHIDQMLGLIRAGKIRPETNRRGGDGRLAESAVRQIYVITAAMFNGAVKKRLIPFTPCVGIEFAETEDHEPAVWGPHEVSRFLAFAAGHEPALAIGFRAAFSFGLRRGEAAGLRWADIDTEAGLLHVRQQLVSVGGEHQIGPPKSRAGRRSVPLSLDSEFAAALRDHRKAHLADRMAAQDWTETGLILAMPDGKPVPLWRLSARFRELVTAAGLPPLSLHGARHTANTAWNAAGVPTFERQSWLGHSSPAMTDRTYLHLRPEQHERAAAQVAAWQRANGASSGPR
jgi:integrase